MLQCSLISCFFFSAAFATALPAAYFGAAVVAASPAVHHASAAVSLSAAFAAPHVSLSAAQGSLSPEMQHEYVRHAAGQLRQQATHELLLELAFYPSIVTVLIVIPSELH